MRVAGYDDMIMGKKSAPISAKLIRLLMYNFIQLDVTIYLLCFFFILLVIMLIASVLYYV